jgi:hypothetical protein
LRDKELVYVRRLAVWRSAINGIAQVIPAFAAVIVYSIYFSTYDIVEAGVIFSALSLFNMVRFSFAAFHDLYLTFPV